MTSSEKILAGIAGEAKTEAEKITAEAEKQAAEITAGALRAHKAAFLVGSASFGKNSSQKIYNFEFPPGETSACKVTYTHYRTPDNLDLGKSGLIPEYVIQAPFGLRYQPLQDKQLKKAFELLQKELIKQR